jgi:hypothetical protein
MLYSFSLKNYLIRANSLSSRVEAFLSVNMTQILVQYVWARAAQAPFN